MRETKMFHKPVCETNVFHGYELVVKNRCAYKGCYDLAQDWSMTFVDETIEQVVSAFWKLYPQSGIEIDSLSLEEVHFVNYQDCVTVIRYIQPVKDYVFSLSTAEAKEGFRLEREFLDKKAQDAQAEVEAKERERELGLLKRLREKYEDD